MKAIPAPQLISLTNTALVPLGQLQESKSDQIWEQFLRVQLKPTTKETYKRAIARFCADNAPNESPAVFLQSFLGLPKRSALQLVLEWRESMIDSGAAAATINQRLAAIKSLVTYAGRAQACDFSLDSIRSLPAKAYRDTRGCSVEDFKAVIAQIDRCTDVGIRDYAIMRILWDLALRRAGVCALDLDDYLPSKQLMVLTKGNFDKESKDLSSGLIEALDEWVGIRRGMCFQSKVGDQEVALFLSCNGRRLTGTDIYRIVSSYAKKIDLTLSPHRTRHSSITAFLDQSGGDVRSAQSLSGHKSLGTLMIYDDNRQGLQGKAAQTLSNLLD